MATLWENDHISHLGKGKLSTQKFFLPTVRGCVTVLWRGSRKFLVGKIVSHFHGALFMAFREHCGIQQFHGFSMVFPKDPSVFGKKTALFLNSFSASQKKAGGHWSQLMILLTCLVFCSETAVSIFKISNHNRELSWSDSEQFLSTRP